MGNILPSILRQPPPPPPPAARKEGKIKPEVVGGNLRSCERKSLSDIESLPDEVLFDVLVRLPAQDVYDSARLVCSKWYRMIHTHTFIYAHLQHSTYGLLFQSTFEDSFFISVGVSGRVEISDISKNRVEISKNRCKKLRRSVQTSCNGLFLEFGSGSYYYLYVSNPATRKIFALPPYDVDYTINCELFGIAYAAASMEYKAVLLLCPAGLGVGKKRMCCILTIGVDNSWRTIGTECVLLETTYKFVDTPLMTKGFLHWYDISSNEVLTLNVETEIITMTSGPIPILVYGNRENIFLSTGRYLSLLRPCGEFCWEVWEMKPKIDYQWRKVWDISLEAHKCSLTQRFRFQEYNYLIPIGWLKYLELLVFRDNDRNWSQIFVFNLLTQEIVTIDLPFTLDCVHYNHAVHKNSLVYLDGC